MPKRWPEAAARRASATWCGRCPPGTRHRPRATPVVPPHDKTVAGGGCPPGIRHRGPRAMPAVPPGARHRGPAGCPPGTRHRRPGP
eukprot:4518541-Lingulodinium_polyedra.AAC.1